MTKRAIMIKTVGDPAIAGALAGATIAQELTAARSELERTSAQLEVSRMLKGQANARKLAALLESYKSTPEPWWEKYWIAIYWGFYLIAHMLVQKDDAPRKRRSGRRRVW